MTLFVDSFSRALAQTFEPKVIGLSLLPLVSMTLLALGLGYFFWDPALHWMRASIDGWPYLASVWGWLDRVGAGSLHGLVAPFLLLLLIVPAVVLAMLALVAVMMTPTLVALVGKRRYPTLERKKGASLAASVWWSLSATAIALVVLVLSMPLWLIPPLVLILPPLIWGWLTYRVMAFDAMSEHASAPERRAIFRRHRTALLTIGVITGYLGAAPAIVWASGIVFAFAFVVLVPVAIWIYTLVFAFSSLWFAHYCLAALAQLREQESAAPGARPRAPTLADPSSSRLLPDERNDPAPRRIPR